MTSGTLEHVGLNVVFLRPGRMGGLEALVHELVPGLLRARPGLRLTLFVNPDAPAAFASLPWRSEVELAVHPLLGRSGTSALSEVTVLPVLARRRRVQLLHSVGITAPLSVAAASVVTIGDLIWRHYPETLDPATAALWRLLVPAAARRADRVVTFTEASRRDIVALLGVPAERVDVIAPGTGLPLVDAPTPEAELRSRLGLEGRPIVLSAAAKRPHKNLLALVRAVPHLRERHPDAVLVLPGHPTPHEEELKSEAARLGVLDSVRFVGWTSEADLDALYRAASCFVFPSLREGFGLPVLEALRRRVPVACSDIAEFREIAGEAACYFDPRDPVAIGTAVARVLADPALAAELVRRGREQARKFTTERMVDETLRTYERAFAARRRPRG